MNERDEVRAVRGKHCADAAARFVARCRPEAETDPWSDIKRADALAQLLAEVHDLCQVTGNAIDATLVAYINNAMPATVPPVDVSKNERDEHMGFMVGDVVTIKNWSERQFTITEFLPDGVHAAVESGEFGPNGTIPLDSLTKVRP
jgi:hypothetical protein